MLEELRQNLYAVIKDTEFEACSYFAGGCVRDELLGRQTNDIDITVELPDGGIRLAEFLYKQGLTSKPEIYKQFGTALIFWHKLKLELVMTRKESYRAKSRKPEVAFGTLLEDVLRRDFTINALLMRISDGEILDLSGNGVNDLKTKYIRATSEPEVLFKEDPLRIMRAIRFAVTLDFVVESATLSNLKEMAAELKHISRERIAEEFTKIISCTMFAKGLQLLQETGIMQVILPGMKIPTAIMTLPMQNYTNEAKLESLSLLGRYALLFWLHNDPTKYLEILKLPKKEIESVNRLTEFCKTIRNQQKDTPLFSVAQLRRKAYWYRDILDLIIELLPLTSMFQQPEESSPAYDLELCDKLRQEAALLDTKRFSLTGDDLIRTFCSENGSWVGEMLTQAREYWFEHPDADKTELLKYLKKLYLN